MTEKTTTQRSFETSVRFGQAAVGLGYVDETALKDALCQQIDDNLSGRPHRLLGTIMLEQGWMSQQQVDAVLEIVLKGGD